MPARVALLAVLAEDRGQPRLGPLVHDRARVELLRRGPCACRAARRRSRRSRARARPPASRRCRGRGRGGRPRAPPRAARAARRRSRPAMKRVAHGASAAKLGEVLLGVRVAVDADDLAPSGRCGRRPGARGRRRRRCSRPTTAPGAGSSAAISSPARTGTWVRVMSRTSVTVAVPDRSGVRRSRRAGSASSGASSLSRGAYSAQRARSQTSIESRLPISVTSLPRPGVLDQRRRQHDPAGGVELAVEGVAAWSSAGGRAPPC